MSAEDAELQRVLAYLLQAQTRSHVNGDLGSAMCVLKLRIALKRGDHRERLSSAEMDAIDAHGAAE